MAKWLRETAKISTQQQLLPLKQSGWVPKKTILVHSEQIQLYRLILHTYAIFFNLQIATAGKENRLQLWDLSRPDVVPVFSAKNVKHDKLELRVPVWVTDICFPDALSPSSVATVSRYGHIR